MPEYSCKMKTLLLFVLIGVVFVIFYLGSEPASTQVLTAPSKTIDQSLLKLEKFLDLIQLTAAQNSANTVPSAVLADYEKIINPELQQNLIGSGNEAKRIYDANQNKMTGQLNLLDTNIRVVMDEVNTKLYKQLGINYERSQQINNMRSDWLTDIGDLPYAALT